MSIVDDNSAMIIFKDNNSTLDLSTEKMGAIKINNIENKYKLNIINLYYVLNIYM